MTVSGRHPSPCSAALRLPAALLAGFACIALLGAPAAVAGGKEAPEASAPAGDSATRAEAAALASLQARLDSLDKSLVYNTGEIGLGDGLAAAHLPEGYRYLDPQQSDKVLTQMWGNPPGDPTLGMIFPPGASPLADDSWAVVVSYEEDGYVEDDDADEIDYDDLLKQMKKEAEAGNKERVKQGYAPIAIIGWAEKPTYDKASNKLYWAKEIRFGEGGENTLNYNIRALGRRGVLVLNAVSSISALDKVREGMKAIQPAVEFKQGHRYSEFNPEIDKVAAYGLAGLVAGTLLAKGGLIKILIAALIAGKKFVIIGLAVVGAGLAKFFKGRSEEKKTIADSAKQIS